MSKKILVIVLIIASTVMLCGCSQTLQTFVNGDLVSQVDLRINANLACVDKLYTAGLITGDKADKLKDDIENNGKRLKNSLEDLSGSTNIGNDVLKSIVRLNQVAGDSDSFLSYAKATGEIADDDTSGPADDIMLSNYIIKENNIKSSGSSEWECVRTTYTRKSEVSKGDAVTIVSIDNESLAINSNYDLYVLDADNVNNIDNCMDAIKETFDKYTNSNGILERESTAELNKYFKDTKKELFDEFDASNLICTTKANDGGHAGELGYDLAITQGGIRIMDIRLNEFNQEAVDNLIYMTSCNSGKYILCPNENRAYLVEYPVQVIDTMYSDGTNVTASLTESDIGVNIRSGEIIKYTKVDGQILPKSTVIGKDIAGYESYLTTYGADTEDSESYASFSMIGKQTIYIESDYYGQPLSEVNIVRSVDTVGIVLRDYLEATYAPGFSEKDENIVLFGRKFRLGINGYDKDSKRISLDSSNTLYMVDMNGENVRDTNNQQKVITIGSHQIMDSTGSILHGKVGDSNYGINRLILQGETDGDPVQSQASSVGAIPKINELCITPRSKINPINRFPSTDIGGSDAGEEDNQPVMYTIATCTDMFESGLYSSWIESSSPTQSIQWWNKWLSNVGYSYTVTAQATEEYLMNNYEFELSQNGVIVLDLETVAKIQSDIDKDNIIKNNETRRTIFKLLGFVIIAYSVIMMVCWVIDTQLGLGIDLYKILSFGKWQAIKYKQDIPVGSKERQYVASGRMFINTIVMMAVGTVIIRLNIVELTYRIIINVGRFAEYISNMLG